MPLDDLPPDARPREKLLLKGAASLVDAELLALLLRTGIKNKNVLQLAQDILQHLGGVAGLLHADSRSLTCIKGLGPAKTAEVMAVIELARRALTETLEAKPVLENPMAMQDYLRLKLGALGHEVFAVLFLDQQQRLLGFEELFRGSIAQATVYPREVALRALHWNAAKVVLAHNHPSGNCEPSHADIALTQRLKSALGLLDIEVIDHVIVGAQSSHSMAEHGYL